MNNSYHLGVATDFYVVFIFWQYNPYVHEHTCVIIWHLDIYI